MMILSRCINRIPLNQVRIVPSMMTDRFCTKPSILVMAQRELTTPNQKPKEARAKFIEDGTRMSIQERLKHMVVLYGPLATVLHIGLSLTFLGITYLVVRFGFDATGYLQKGGFMSESYARILATGGTFGLAYAVYKAMMPFRVMVTFYLTPKVANKLISMGLIKKRF